MVSYITDPVFQCYYSSKYHSKVACDKMLETYPWNNEILKSLIALLQQKIFICDNVLEKHYHEVLANCFQIALHNFQNNSQLLSLTHILRRDIK